MRARLLPLVWGTGNCRSLSFGSSLDPLRLTRRALAAAGELRYHTDRPQLRAAASPPEIRSLGNWFRLRPPKIEHVLSTTRGFFVTRNFGLRRFDRRVLSRYREFERSLGIASKNSLSIGIDLFAHWVVLKIPSGIVILFLYKEN